MVDVRSVYARIRPLIESTDWIELGFVEREWAPSKIVEKGTTTWRLALLNTVALLEELGVDCSRVAIHNFVKKAKLQPAGGHSPDCVAFDQKTIRINDEQYWLNAAVDPRTNRILHSRLSPTYTIPITWELLNQTICGPAQVNESPRCVRVKGQDPP